MTGRTIIYFSLLVGGLLLSSTPAWAQQGDALRGEALFSGRISFKNGGAPCMACHAIDIPAIGMASGASYGPDLTGLFADYGEEGVAGVLEDLSFESMKAIYTERPLTKTEQADLVAFFSTVVPGERSDTGVLMVFHAAIAAVLFLVLIGLLSLRKLRGVRKPLVEKACFGKGGVS